MYSWKALDLNILLERRITVKIIFEIQLIKYCYCCIQIKNNNLLTIFSDVVIQYILIFTFFLFTKNQ